MISFRNNRKRFALSFKVIVVCLLLSGSLITPSFANGAPALTNGRYNCNTGAFEPGSTTGYFTIASDVVTGDNICAGAVIIPDGVRSIGNRAFLSQTQLTSVTIPNSVTSIGDYAFYENYKLTSVTIPDSVITIGDNAFYNNIRLISVIIGNSVTSIGAYAFTTTGLITITIPDSVTSIDQAAFENNAALTTVTFLGNRLSIIGQSVFAFNPNLRSITIPNSVTSIADYAFEESGLESIAIPNSVTSIGSAAFYGNTALTLVTIGNSVTSIGVSAFEASDLRSVIIPNSVSSIGEYAFAFTPALTSVTIGNSVTSIGASAFEGSDLRSVIIPNSVSSIGGVAFLNNDLLTSFTFLHTAAPTLNTDSFFGLPTGATANVPYNATGFVSDLDGFWNYLTVIYASAPVDDPPPSGGDSGSSSSNVATITPTVFKSADASFKLTNRKYLSKYAMKTKLSMNKSFKRNAEDLYKYSIFKESKKSCGMRGNYVMRYENSKTCDLYITRTNSKGISNKYWVKINYSK